MVWNDVCNVIAYLLVGFGFKKLEQSVLIKDFVAEGLKLRKTIKFEVLYVWLKMTAIFFIKNLY